MRAADDMEIGQNRLWRMKLQGLPSNPGLQARVPSTGLDETHFPACKIISGVWFFVGALSSSNDFNVTRKGIEMIQ